MTDRELLIMAAEAAYLPVVSKELCTSRVGTFKQLVHSRRDVLWLDGKEWNPIVDDGDALRLAVKIGMLIDIRYTNPKSIRYNRVVGWPAPNSDLIIEFGYMEMDPMAATRRSIVIAAAKIGEATKD